MQVRLGIWRMVILGTTTPKIINSLASTFKFRRQFLSLTLNKKNAEINHFKS